jgi:ribonucleotide reductase alpha subunit
MQSSAQEYVGNSISKTCNLNNSATLEDVYNAFILAYKEEMWRQRLLEDRKGQRQRRMFGINIERNGYGL